MSFRIRLLIAYAISASLALTAVGLVWFADDLAFAIVDRPNVETFALTGLFALFVVSVGASWLVALLLEQR